MLTKALIIALTALGLFAAKQAIPSPPASPPASQAIPSPPATDPATTSQKSPPPAHYSLAVKFDKPKYFLGENVLLDFIVQNTGTAPFVIGTGGDYRGTYRQTRFKVKATAEDGSCAPDPHPNAEMFCMGGLGGSSKLAATDTFTQTLALADYARILKAGKYKVAVSHDLDWDTGNNLPTAIGAVEFVLPSPDQARAVVERMYKLQKDHSHNLSGGKGAAYANFTTLSYPVYLAPLLAKAQSPQTPEDQAEQALIGIGSIPTPEATSALISFAQMTKNNKLALQAARQLETRLPQNSQCTTGECPLASLIAEQNNWIVSQSWRGTFAPSVRLLAEKFLHSGDKDLQAVGGSLTKGFGSGKDLPSLTRALDQALIRSKTLPVDKYFSHRPRGQAPELLQAAGALATKATMPGDPKNAGQAAVFMSVIAKDKTYRPAGWQAQYKKFLASDIPYLRELALKTCPMPAPAVLIPGISALIKDSDLDVQCAAVRLAITMHMPAFKTSLASALSTANDNLLIKQLCDALSAFDKSQTLLILASRFGEAEPENGVVQPRWPVLELLGRAIDAPGWGSRVGVPGPQLSAERLAENKVKQQWINLIKTNRPFFQSGGRLKPGDPRLRPDLFPPYFCCLADANGDGNTKEWPPMSQEIQAALINLSPEYYSSAGMPKPIKPAGQTTPEVNLSDKTTQQELLEKTKAVLPAKWKITSTHAGGLPEDWITKDGRTTFCIEAAGPEGIAKVWFVPADWVGILQSKDHKHASWDWICWDHVLSDRTYKIMAQGEMPFINTSFWKILQGAHTACLIDKVGFDMDRQIFEGKLTSAQTQAQELIDENCKTEAALAEGVNSLIELGVPAKAIILKSAKLLHDPSGGRDAFEAIEHFGGAEATNEAKNESKNEAKEVLLQILSDPSSDESVLFRAAETLDHLGDCSDPRSVQTLTQALERTKYDGYIFPIAQALAHTGDPSAGKTVFSSFMKMQGVYEKVQVADILANLHCHDAAAPIEQLEATINSSTEYPRHCIDAWSERVKTALQRLKE